MYGEQRRLVAGVCYCSMNTEGTNFKGIHFFPIKVFIVHYVIREPEALLHIDIDI